MQSLKVCSDSHSPSLTNWNEKRGGTPIDEESTGLENIAIIAGNTITVDDVPGLAEGQKVELSFYAYLGQASVGTAAEAYTACFGTQDGT